MTDDWTDEMQRQFDRLKQELADVVRTELRSTERTLGDQFKRELTSAERRLSTQYQTQVETVRKEVRLAAEAFGGTLDGINRRIQALEENVVATLKDHAKILFTHSRQIDELNRRSGH